MIIRELETKDLDQLVSFMNNVPSLWGIEESKIIFKNAILNAFLNSDLIFYGGFNNDKIDVLGSIYYWKLSKTFTLSSIVTTQSPSVSNFKNLISPMTNHILHNGIENNCISYYRAYPLKYAKVWRKMSSKYSVEHNKFDHFIDQIVPANSWPKHAWQRSFLMNRIWPIDTIIEYGVLKLQYRKVF